MAWLIRASRGAVGVLPAAAAQVRQFVMTEDFKPIERDIEAIVQALRRIDNHCHTLLNRDKKHD